MGEKGRVYNENAQELISNIKGDVLYLDPPYNHRQYCSNYHLLETIARYDNPVLHGVTGLRDCTQEKSVFCSRKQVESALDSLISQAEFQYIVLSYNADGLLSPEQIQKMMEQYGKYHYVAKEYQKYANKQAKQGTTTEFLHCLHKQ